MTLTVWQNLRRRYHRALCDEVVWLSSAGYPNNADKSNKTSREVARLMWEQIAEVAGCRLPHKERKPQQVGKSFEAATRRYLEKAFGLLQHLRPGDWRFYLNAHIQDFAQYRHLADLTEALHAHPALRAALGDYLIAPDIIVAREPLPDETINREGNLVEGRTTAGLSPLRRVNNAVPLLHASVSCKWTIRSDRSQNVRTEGLNLIRNRKGHTPHIVVVTAEPHPGRLASLALGTGDLDCVYHVALPELQQAVAAVGDETAQGLLKTMISGQRLRDISDLPLDLAA